MDIFQGSSNYQEINTQARKKAAEHELLAWGERADKFANYRLEWKKAAEQEHVPLHPLHVDIELSDACNLRCRMCVHAGGMQDVGFMSDDLVYRLIDECAEIGVFSIKFNWRGEALLNPLLPAAVNYAKDKGILEVQLNTNGLFPKKFGNVIVKCAENGLDRVIFSVDGFSKKTYEEIRTGGNYEELLKNIHSLLDWRKKKKSLLPLVRVQMVRTTINEAEVAAFIQYWQQLVDDVRISDATDRGQGGALIVGDQVAVGRTRCPQPFQRLVVGRNGLGSPCCSDWNQEYVLGDVSTDKLMTLWNNKKMKQLRKVQNERKLETVDICKKCFVKESYIWEKKGKL